MKTDDVDCLVDSVGGESQVKSVSSQKLGQSDANESDSESDSDSSSDEDMVCSGKGYRIWEWDQLRYLITTSLVTASKDCQYVSTSPIQGKCADVNTVHSGNEEYWTWEVSSKEIQWFHEFAKPVTYNVWSRKTEKLSETVMDLADKQMKDSLFFLSFFVYVLYPMRQLSQLH